MNKIFRNQIAAGASAYRVSHHVQERWRLKNLLHPVSIIRACCLSAFLGVGLPAQGAVNVTQHHNHLSRDGLYIDPFFTTNIAASLTRDAAFDGAIIGDVYAQPLYVEGGPRGGALVVAVTESNYVFALDASDGSVVWQTNVAPPISSGVQP
jgi:hypothetical protein